MFLTFEKRLVILPDGCSDFVSHATEIRGEGSCSLCKKFRFCHNIIADDVRIRLGLMSLVDISPIIQPPESIQNRQNPKN